MKSKPGGARKVKEDRLLPRRVYLRRNRYYFVRPEDDKWISLSHVRDGLPGVSRALQELLGPAYVRLLPAPAFHVSSARRAEAIARRTPKWADHAAIDAIYAEARRITAETGVPYHVDHEIPLLGKLVSGLHVETNLRVLAGADNIAKGNGFEPC